MDMNKFAQEITLSEGMKKSVSIAQVKEILKLTFKKIAHMELSELVNLLKRYE